MKSFSLHNKPIPYGRQTITQEDIDAVVQTLNSDFLTQGPKVQEFEEAFASYVGSKFAVAVSSATAGLHLAVKSLGVKKGDRVITAPITFAATANCVRFQEGEVWFADIDPDTYLMSIESVKDLIKKYPKGFFKGLIPVDFAGLPVNLELLKEVADENQLWIIEDACHAPGGYFIDSKGIKQKCGSCEYNDMSVFSFHPVKHIACGEGGMVTTNSIEIYKKLLLYRTHGITKENLSQSDGNWYYEMKALGHNYRLTDLQSALGLSQLKKNDLGLDRRNFLADRYKQAFKGKIKFQSLPEYTYNAHHLFVIEVNNRKELYSYLASKNIHAQVHYRPIHKLKYYEDIGYSEANLMNSEKYYSKCLSLPMYPGLSDEEQDYVIKTVLEFYG